MKSDLWLPLLAAAALIWLAAFTFYAYRLQWRNPFAKLNATPPLQLEKNAVESIAEVVTTAPKALATEHLAPIPDTKAVINPEPTASFTPPQAPNPIRQEPSLFLETQIVPQALPIETDTAPDAPPVAQALKVEAAFPSFTDEAFFSYLLIPRTPNAAQQAVIKTAVALWAQPFPIMIEGQADYLVCKMGLRSRKPADLDRSLEAFHRCVVQLGEQLGARPVSLHTDEAQSGDIEKWLMQQSAKADLANQALQALDNVFILHLNYDLSAEAALRNSLIAANFEPLANDWRSPLQDHTDFLYLKRAIANGTQCFEIALDLPRLSFEQIRRSVFKLRAVCVNAGSQLCDADGQLLDTEHLQTLLIEAQRLQAELSQLGFAPSSALNLALFQPAYYLAHHE